LKQGEPVIAIFMDKRFGPCRALSSFAPMAARKKRTYLFLFILSTDIYTILALHNSGQQCLFARFAFKNALETDTAA
jgi:hypothetical protein